MKISSRSTFAVSSTLTNFAVKTESEIVKILQRLLLLSLITLTEAKNVFVNKSKVLLFVYHFP